MGVRRPWSVVAVVRDMEEEMRRVRAMQQRRHEEASAAAAQVPGRCTACELR